MKTTLKALLCAFLTAATLPAPALAVETVHMGYSSGYPALTDALRLSTRIGEAWWSKEKEYWNPENGVWIPYAYHDGYFDMAGRSSSELAARWNQVLSGGGDPWVPTRMLGQLNYPGRPTLIILDEIGGAQSDLNGGQHLLEALQIYCATYGTREDIMAYTSPGVTQTASPATTYSKVVTAATHYLRRLCLELYLSHESYVTGNNNSGLNPTGLQGDPYLNARLGNPIRRWVNAGVPASRVMPILAISNTAESQGVTSKGFYKFLNRQFWWMANGRYGNNLTDDAGIIAALRGGVGSYSWSPDTAGDGAYKWKLAPGETMRDTFVEKYIMWYCVGGNKAAHSDGVDALPGSPTPGIAEIKAQPDGTTVTIERAAVTAAFDGFLYIGSDDRTSGLRVRKAAHGVSPGMRVDVVGALATSTEGERFIEATKVLQNGVSGG